MPRFAVTVIRGRKCAVVLNTGEIRDIYKSSDGYEYFTVPNSNEYEGYFTDKRDAVKILFRGVGDEVIDNTKYDRYDKYQLRYYIDREKGNEIRRENVKHYKSLVRYQNL